MCSCVLSSQLFWTPVYTSRCTRVHQPRTNKGRKVNTEGVFFHFVFVLHLPCGACHTFFTRKGFTGSLPSSTVTSIFWCTYNLVALHSWAWCEDQSRINVTSSRFKPTTQPSKGFEITNRAAGVTGPIISKRTVRRTETQEIELDGKKKVDTPT